MVKVIARSLLFVGLIALQGCTSLEPIRKYAHESAKFSAYTELTERFCSTYDRERFYLQASADKMALQNDQQRKAAKEDLIRLHQGLKLYMETLATLAGEDQFDLGSGIDALAGGFAAHPDLGISQPEVDAYRQLTQVLARWATSNMRERAIQHMVREGDPHLQVTLGTLKDLLRLYKKTHANEKKTLMNFYRLELLYKRGPEDRLLATLTRLHEHQQQMEYQRIEQLYTEAEQGVRKIAEGHQALANSLDDLSANELKTSLQNLAKDIKQITKALPKLSG